MADELSVNNGLIRLTKGDITDLEIQAFVYYAQPSLALGSGFGGAIAVRGGSSIQEELKGLGPIGVTEVVVTRAGKLKADYIIHAVGPRFQEEDTEGKLRRTILNVLRQAEAYSIRQIAFPPMGAGFYGVPLDLCAEVMFETVMEHLRGQTGIKEVVFCLLDNREYKPFGERLATLSRGGLKVAS
jgi:O-acetyl-ADP-ribose deacetylase (regulator of RNase III)